MLNPKQVQQAMKKLGIQTEEVDAEEVVIKTKDKDIIISNPKVSKVKMGGQETFQVMGEISEKNKEKFSEEDIKMIMEQTDCSEEEARKALKETNDIAEAILKLKN